MKPTTSIRSNGKPCLSVVPIPESGLPPIDPATVGIKARPKLTVVIHEYHEGNPLTDEEIDVIVNVITPYWNPGNRPMLSLAIPGWLASIGVPEEDACTVMDRLMACTGEAS